MTIPRNLPILAEYAGTVNAPILNLTNTAIVVGAANTASRRGSAASNGTTCVNV
jgi:hypothetical protein